MKQEIYNSSTHGEIPLSFTGRHLLQTLREAIEDAVSAEDYKVNAQAVSRARAQLAHYMSHLEGFKIRVEIKDFSGAVGSASTNDLNEEAIEEMLEEIFKSTGIKPSNVNSIKPSTKYFTPTALRTWFGWSDKEIEEDRRKVAAQK